MGTYTKEQLTDELNRIKTATSACRDAIYNKGVTSIPADASLGSLATYASMITCDHPDILLEYIQADETPSSEARTTVYFKTDYDNHNLERARNQLALSYDIKDKMAEMTSIIKELTF